MTIHLVFFLFLFISHLRGEIIFQWPPAGFVSTSVKSLADGPLAAASSQIVLSRQIALDNNPDGAIARWNITGRALCLYSVNVDLFAELQLDNALTDGVSGSMIVDFRGDMSRADGLVLRGNGVIGFNVGLRGFWTFVLSSTDDAIQDGDGGRLGFNATVVDGGRLELFWSGARTARGARSVFTPLVPRQQSHSFNVSNMTSGEQAPLRFSIWGRWSSDFCIDRWVVQTDRTLAATPRTTSASLATTLSPSTVQPMTSMSTSTSTTTTTLTTSPTMTLTPASAFASASNGTTAVQFLSETLENVASSFPTSGIIGIAVGLAACCLLVAVVVGVAWNRRRKVNIPLDDVVSVSPSQPQESTIQYGKIPRTNSPSASAIYDVGNIDFNSKPK